MKTKLAKLYRDYFNNFLTIGAFADHYFFTDEQASRIIEIGRKAHNRGF